MRNSLILLGLLILSSVVLMEPKDQASRQEEEVVPKGYFYYFFDNEADYTKLLGLGEKGYEKLQVIKFSAESFSKVSGYKGELKEAFLFDNIPLHQSISTDEIVLDQLTMHNIASLTNDGFFGSVKIGVIDTGADFSLPLLSSIDYVKQSFAGIYAEAPDDHGTAVISNIAGSDGFNTLGYATNATIYDAEMGSEYFGTISGDFIGAFEWLINQSVIVINTSFGGPVSLWEPIVRKVYEHNITLVGSIGNAGQNDGIVNNDKFTATGPGSTIHAISIGAVDSAGSLASFSSEGPTFSYLQKPDFLSKGVNVKAAKTDGSVGLFAGTSFSSPLMAGAVAVLAEAMKSQGIYSPSALKTTLMKHTYTLPSLTSVDAKTEYTVGQGIANFSEAWIDLKLNGLTEVMITPSTIPYDFQIYHSRGSVQQLHAWIFSAVDSSLLNIEVLGNISQILDVGTIDKMTQRLPVYINSSLGDPFGNYTGVIRVNGPTRNSSTNITIVMDHDYRATIMLDLRYTDYDDNGSNRIPGLSLGSTIERLWNEGYYFVENREKLSLNSLEDIDILWLDDFVPNSLFLGDSLSDYSDVEGKIIQDYISSGGKVIVDFLGKFETSSGVESILGTSNIITDLFDDFNMKLRDTHMAENLLTSKSTWQVPTTNILEITNNLDEMTHRGNYIELLDYNDPRTSIVVSDPNYIWRNPVVVHDVIGGGRVVLISSQTLRDDISATDGYQGDNWELFHGIIDWLQSPKLTMDRPDIGVDYLSGNIVHEGPEILEVKYSTNGITYNDLALTQSGSEYFYNLTIAADRYYFNIEAGSRYLNKTLIVDTTPPVIHFHRLPGSNITLPQSVDFTLVEDNLASIDVYSYEDHKFDYSLDGTLLTIQLDTTTPISAGKIVIFIDVADIAGHTLEYTIEYIYFTEIFSITLSPSETISPVTTSEPPPISTPTSPTIIYSEDFKVNYPLIILPLFIVIIRKFRGSISRIS